MFFSFTCLAWQVGKEQEQRQLALPVINFSETLRFLFNIIPQDCSILVTWRLMNHSSFVLAQKEEKNWSQQRLEIYSRSNYILYYIQVLTNQKEVPQFWNCEWDKHCFPNTLKENIFRNSILISTNSMGMSASHMYTPTSSLSAAGRDVWSDLLVIFRCFNT